jgi:flagellar biosynthesis/type III secretory pathway protein FliH
MPGTFTINLAKPVISADILDSYGGSPLPGTLQNGSTGTDGNGSGRDQTRAIADTQQLALMQDLEQQRAQVAGLHRTLNGLVAKLSQFHDEVVTKHKEEIAKLAVEIANRVLMQKVQDGDYQIESIITEALESAPTQQDVVVHLNPQDLEQCQKLQQEDPSGAFATVTLVADAGVARAECLLETPKGTIKSFLEDHLERISEALQTVE